MTARHLETGRIYEGTKVFIGKVIGRNRNTLARWERQNIKSKEYNGYEIRFLNVIREKNNRGKHNAK